MLKTDIVNKPLQYFLIQGIKVIPLVPGKKCPLLPWKGESGYKNFTGNVRQVKAYWQKGFKAYAFIPAKYNMVVIDIDIKQGIDGLTNFKNYLFKQQIIIPFSIDEPPVYTRTPSGGMHIYFRYSGPDIKNSVLCPGVEIKYTTLITAPGSQNQKGKYIFHGTFNNLPIFPYRIQVLLTLKQKRKKQYIHFFDRIQNRPFSLNEIYEYTVKKHGAPIPGNRDNFCFNFALYSFHNKYNESEIANRLSTVISEDFPMHQLRKCILSAGSYREKRI